MRPASSWICWAKLPPPLDKGYAPLAAQHKWDRTSAPKKIQVTVLVGLGLSAWACGPRGVPDLMTRSQRWVRGVEARHRCVLGLWGGGPKGGGTAENTT